jgi:hypothetical protein
VLAFDFETLLIQPALQAPPPVCMSTSGPSLHPTPEARDVFVGMLRSDVPLIGHNVTYDLACALAWWGCTEEVIAALEADRIGDTWVIERLAEIGGLTPRKVLSLDVLYAAHGFGHLPKDEVRLSYGPLLNRPLTDYSEAQKRYAIDDSLAALAVYERQKARWIDKGLIHWRDVAFLTRKRLWLECIRAYGLRTNPAKIEGLRVAAAEHLGDLRAQAKALGVMRADGTRDMKALRMLVSEAYSGRPPMTKEQKGRKAKSKFVPQVSTARATLEESGDSRLEALAELGEWSSVENTVLPAFERGTVEPIHTKWGMADTTRITSSNPNVTNIRRKAGIRECFEPRRGFCFVAIDHGGLENATLAQVIKTNLRRSRLCDFLNSGGDLHCLVAAQVHCCSYEQAVALHEAGDEAFGNVRNAVKPINFGRPGGAGWKTLRFIAKQIYHLDWSEAETRRYIKAWEQAVPDGKAYLDWVSSLPEDAHGRRSVPIPGTTITRRGCTYCSACNNGFQSLGATVEAACGWEMLKARLRGQIVGAMVNFVHDEFIWEVPIGWQTQTAAALEWIMCNVPRKYLPDVRIGAEAKAMAFWSKKAKRIVRNGELCIWPEAA